MNDYEAFQQDQEHREQLALDCLTVCAKHGLEGTANTLARLLGLSQLWGQRKDQLTRRVA
jgi:hypothetical protein